MDLTRRQFVTGLTASCLLCGCGASEKQGPAPPTAGTPPEPPPDPLVEIPAACRSQGGYDRIALPSGETVIVWRDEAGLHALEGRCTHRRGALEYDAESHVVVCPDHGSRFYIDGAVAKGPAKVALQKYRVEEVEGRMRITRRG